MHNFEYKIVCHCIEEYPFKIRKNCNSISVVVITALKNTCDASQTKQMWKKIGFFILGEQRKAEIKKQQNKNATKSPFQCLFSAIILSQLLCYTTCYYKIREQAWF